MTNVKFLFTCRPFLFILSSPSLSPSSLSLSSSFFFFFSLSLSLLSLLLLFLLPLSLLSIFSQTRYDHHQSHGDNGLKQALAELIPEKQAEVKEFRANHGGLVVGDVNIDMVSAHLSPTPGV